MFISRAQYAVLTGELGVKKVFCVVGFSMGGQQVSLIGLWWMDSISTYHQAYHWSVVYPDFVDRIVVICSSARTSPHNKWCVYRQLARMSHNMTNVVSLKGRDTP